MPTRSMKGPRVRFSRDWTRGSKAGGSRSTLKADEMRLGPLLSGPKQFVVPYFQRAYSWRRHQWNTLFDDILELYELGSSSSHFLGPMVLLNDPSGPVGGGLSPTLGSDRQQAIVTLSPF